MEVKLKMVTINGNGKKTSKFSLISMGQFGDGVVARNLPYVYKDGTLENAQKGEENEDSGFSLLVRSFISWNGGGESISSKNVDAILDLLNTTSWPYMSMQNTALKMVEEILLSEKKNNSISACDSGSGRADFWVKVFKNNSENPDKINRLFAMDLDGESLLKAPQLLFDAGYRHLLILCQLASICETPFDDESIKLFTSIFGGLTYGGWWYEKNGTLICDKREALRKNLTEVYRILRPGGYLVFSSPKPNPNWSKILLQSIIHPLFNSEWEMLFRALWYGRNARKKSTFMYEFAKEKYAHYLDLKNEDNDDWTTYLKQAGFEIIEAQESFANQCWVIKAQKPKNSYF